MKRFVQILAVLILIPLAYCTLIYPQQYPSGSWRYKTTVTVETPEGIKTGSAVREVSVQTGPSIFNGGDGTSVKVAGEAVAIDLGSRGPLFAIMRSPKTEDYSYQVFFDSFPLPDPSHRNIGGGSTPAGVRYYDQLKQGEASLPADEYPDFVRFHDLKDPKTVESVDPANMAASFGEGVKLVGIKIEITNEPVTTEIKNRLAWLSNLHGSYLDGGHVNRSRELANTLNTGDFIRGEGTP